MSAGEVHVALEVDVSGYLAALARASDAGTGLRAMLLPLRRVPDPHHPRPMSVDGHAYHRRTRARRRRR